MLRKEQITPGKKKGGYLERSDGEYVIRLGDFFDNCKDPEEKAKVNERVYRSLKQEVDEDEKYEREYIDYYVPLNEENEGKIIKEYSVSHEDDALKFMMLWDGVSLKKKRGPYKNLGQIYPYSMQFILRNRIRDEKSNEAIKNFYKKEDEVRKEAGIMSNYMCDNCLSGTCDGKGCRYYEEGEHYLC